MKIVHNPDPLPLREQAYMPAGDQLDAIMKGFEAMQAAGMTLPQQTLDWIAHCKAIKVKFQKIEVD